MTERPTHNCYPFEVFRCLNLRGWSADILAVALNTSRWVESSLTKEKVEMNERNDTKLALAGVELQEGGLLKFHLRYTTWFDVQRIRSQNTQGGKLCVSEIEPRKFVIDYPNILSAHCVCVTSDNLVPVFQRSLSSSYYPGAWSATFEEGLEPDDYLGGNTFRVAARRGAAEEMSIAFCKLPFEFILPLSVVVEQEACNPAVVLLIRLPQTAKELVELIEHNDELNAGSLKFIDAEPGALTAFLARMGTDGQQWHPTSKYRLSLVLDYFDQQGASGRSGV